MCSKHGPQLAPIDLVRWFWIDQGGSQSRCSVCLWFGAGVWCSACFWRRFLVGLSCLALKYCAGFYPAVPGLLVNWSPNFCFLVLDLFLHPVTRYCSPPVMTEGQWCEEGIDFLRSTNWVDNYVYSTDVVIYHASIICINRYLFQIEKYTCVLIFLFPPGKTLFSYHFMYQ